MNRTIAGSMLIALLASFIWTPSFALASQASENALVLRVASLVDEDEEPRVAGRQAAESLVEKFGKIPLKAVVVSECFDGKEAKKALLAGLKQILPAEKIYGLSTYGSFTQEGCTDYDAVCLLGIGGKVEVKTAVIKNTGTSKLLYQDHQTKIHKGLDETGQSLARQLAFPEKQAASKGKLLICLADAHSPKNQSLVEGVQKVLGVDYPLTGGSANKNAGQTFVYYQGEMLVDSVVGLHLAGNFKTAMIGRQAKTNDTVIRTAGQGMQEALAMVKNNRQIDGVLAFNCAGRRSKLEQYEDELTAMQKSLGKQLPLFGCYCAGEIGPLDIQTDKKGKIGGNGWHVMFSVIYE